MKKNIKKQTNGKSNHVALVIPDNVDQIAMTAEQSNKVRELEQKVLQAKLQLADVGIQISDLQEQKNHLVSFIRSTHQEMMNEVRGVATSFGIDVDGVKDNRKWNLDTNEMIFRLVKNSV